MSRILWKHLKSNKQYCKFNEYQIELPAHGFNGKPICKNCNELIDYQACVLVHPKSDEPNPFFGNPETMKVWGE